MCLFFVFLFYEIRINVHYLHIGGRTNNICERMQRSLKDLQDRLRVRTDRVVRELHKRLVETAAEEARLDRGLNKSQVRRRQERLRQESLQEEHSKFH